MSLDSLFDASAAARKKAVDGITIRRPDDWHVHLRDGAMLRAVLPFTAGQFARGIIMPNLVPPVTDMAAARAYRARILAALPAGAVFTPLMTCYLTDATDPQEVARGYEEGVFAGVKLYPAHATTYSAAGVTDHHCVAASIVGLRIGDRQRGGRYTREMAAVRQVCARMFPMKVHRGWT